MSRNTILYVFLLMGLAILLSVTTVMGKESTRPLMMGGDPQPAVVSTPVEGGPG